MARQSHHPGGEGAEANVRGSGKENALGLQGERDITEAGEGHEAGWACAWERRLGSD